MLSLSESDLLPSNWQFQASLNGNNVYDVITILALLEDHISQKETFTIPYTGDQSDWLIKAMGERNHWICVMGQPEISHYCLKCT